MFFIVTKRTVYDICGVVRKAEEDAVVSGLKHP
jgi:hypothetical protein